MYKYKDLEPVLDWREVLREKDVPNVEANVYVEGSYSWQLDDGGIGIFITDELGTKLFAEYKNIDDEDNDIRFRSACATELNAALRAIKVVRAIGIKKINLIYDCNAIKDSLIATRTKSDELFQYRNFMANLIEGLEVNFRHAKYYKHAIHNNAHRLSSTYLAS